jgi:type VI secretion system protein VasG
VADHHKAEFAWNEDLVDAVLARCTEADAGARNVDNILNGTLLPQIAETVLERMADGRGIAKIKVGVTKKGDFSYRIQ